MNKLSITKKQLTNIIKKNMILESEDTKQLLLDNKLKCQNCGFNLQKGEDICPECHFSKKDAEKLVKENKEILISLKKLWDPKYINEVTYKVSGKNPTNVANLAKTTKPEDTIEVTDEVVDKTTKKIDLKDSCSKLKKNKKKYDKCVKVKKFQDKIDEDLSNLEIKMKRIIMDGEQKPKMKKGSFVQFVSKLK